MDRLIDTILFDLDGTLYFKGMPIEKAIDTISALRAKGYKLSFVTNTDGRTVESIYNRVFDLGFDIQLKEIFTPIIAALTFLGKRSDKTVYCLLRDDVKNGFMHMNLDHKNPDYVLIGDFEDKASYDEMNSVFRFIKNGAQILATNKSMHYYTPDGINLCTGAFVKMFEEASGKEAILLGKPSTDFFQLALERLDSEASRTLIVGDDITTDIKGAKGLGALSALVRTGHFTKESLEKSPHKPDYIFDSVADLINIL